MQTVTIDFTPIKLANLGPADMAKLLRVSRVTASLWLNGHKQPHHLHSESVSTLIDKVARALGAGLLPVPHNVTRRERGLYLQKVLTQVTP